jgi:prepilin-type N-terminal cleavage/methylation domain-containing protein
MRNIKGFTLLEVMAAVTVLGLIGYYFNSSILISLKLAKKKQDALQASITQAAALKAALDQYFASNPDRKVIINSACTQIDGQYYGKKVDGDTVRIYDDGAGCGHTLGTLNRVSNPNWVNDASNSLWVVYSYSGELKVLVFKLNIFN